MIFRKGVPLSNHTLTGKVAATCHPARFLILKPRSPPRSTPVAYRPIRRPTVSPHRASHPMVWRLIGFGLILHITNTISMETTRQNKIARLIQKELSDMFEKQTRMTHGIIVTVSKCRISPDLSVCTSYISVFPSEKAREIVANVNANARSLRYELGKRVRYQLRIIPELRFFVDDSLDYIKHIDDLLAQ